ncbi:hypothetical protein ACFPA8_07755 [Streptomyces ovatisporus]|uniref:DUF2188 domain-containing protein n=1 Tax=Streptomyces ovatisporus TaxID=1128682 RepID=A0ABV9A4Y7_9ACTN
MNYTEKYELRWKGTAGGWKILGDNYDTEAEAVTAMEKDSEVTSGAWRVVRVSEVTTHSKAKA